MGLALFIVTIIVNAFAGCCLGGNARRAIRGALKPSFFTVGC